MGWHVLTMASQVQSATGESNIWKHHRTEAVFSDVLKLFEHVWTCLSLFEIFWGGLDKFENSKIMQSLRVQMSFDVFFDSVDRRVHHHGIKPDAGMQAESDLIAGCARMFACSICNVENMWDYMRTFKNIKDVRSWKCLRWFHCIVQRQLLWNTGRGVMFVMPCEMKDTWRKLKKQQPVVFCLMCCNLFGGKKTSFTMFHCVSLSEGRANSAENIQRFSWEKVRIWWVC